MTTSPFHLLLSPAFLLFSSTLFLPSFYRTTLHFFQVNPLFSFLFLHFLSALTPHSSIFNLTRLSFPLFPPTNSRGNANQSQLHTTSSNSAPASFLQLFFFFFYCTKIWVDSHSADFFFITHVDKANTPCVMETSARQVLARPDPLDSLHPS